MAISARHPRFLIALLVLVSLSIFLLANSPHTPVFQSHSPFKYPKPTHGDRRPPPGYEVQHQLKESEERYQDMIKERHALIRKFGPTVDTIESFPSGGKFYTLWDFFTPAFQCPHRVQRIGTLGDGGKWVCGMEIIEKKKDCVVYSFGINDESSFEASILERAPGCQIWGYDFSVKSFGPEISSSPALSPRAHFHPYALGDHDAPAPTSGPPTFTLPTLMRANNHTFIDVLKIDIEGSEYTALEAFLDAFVTADSPAAVLPVGQLQLEVHAVHYPYVVFARFLAWWQRLEGAGLRPFWTEPNLVYVNIVRGSKPDLAEYSFINTRGDHDLLRDD